MDIDKYVEWVLEEKHLILIRSYSLVIDKTKNNQFLYEIKSDDLLRKNFDR